jgi:secreted trypsin-like serine protease
VCRENIPLSCFGCRKKASHVLNTLGNNTTAGAVLIGPRLVLGAAHCADADTRFRVGAWEDVNDGHEVGIKKSIVHENYSDSRYDHDIVLFQLEEDTPNPYIKLGKEEVTGGKLTVIGFGDIDPSVHKEISSVLREVELNYVDNESCDEGHGGNGDITEDMLCAWGRQKDSCVGDR